MLKGCALCLVTVPWHWGTQAGDRQQGSTWLRVPCVPSLTLFAHGVNAPGARLLLEVVTHSDPGASCDLDDRGKTEEVLWKTPSVTC